MAKDARLIHGRKLSEKFATEVPLVEDLLNTKGSMDPYGSQAYDESLYRNDNVASGISSLDEITDTHVKYYRENGFLAIQNAFSPAQISDAITGLDNCISGKYPAYDGIQYERVKDVDPESLSFDEKKKQIRKLSYFLDHEKLFQSIVADPQFLSVMKKLINATPEIHGDQALFKPPLIGREKPWHQDHAFFDLPSGTKIIGCWIALDKATLENGCMHVKPGTHNEGPVKHLNKRDWQICDTHLDLTRDVAVPLNPGGLLLFDGLLHHGTPANRTSEFRRSLQFHFTPKGTRESPVEERIAIFGMGGENVTC